MMPLFLPVLQVAAAVLSAREVTVITVSLVGLLIVTPAQTGAALLLTGCAAPTAPIGCVAGDTLVVRPTPAAWRVEICRGPLLCEASNWPATDAEAVAACRAFRALP